MEKQPWMLFRLEDCSAYYFWDGTFPVLVQVTPPYEKEDFFWDGFAPKELEQGTVKRLNEIAFTKRKTVFKLPDRSPRYIVVARGVFEQE